MTPANATGAQREMSLDDALAMTFPASDPVAITSDCEVHNNRSRELEQCIRKPHLPVIPNISIRTF